MPLARLLGVAPSPTRHVDFGKPGFTIGRGLRRTVLFALPLSAHRINFGKRLLSLVRVVKLSSLLRPSRTILCEVIASDRISKTSPLIDKKIGVIKVIRKEEENVPGPLYRFFTRKCRMKGISMRSESSEVPQGARLLEHPTGTRRRPYPPSEVDTQKACHRLGL
jgi:hypothetical protein